MSTNTSEVAAVVKQYILSEFLKGEDPDALTLTTPLISGGIMDSLSNMKLVTFLEQKFDVTIEAHEISPDYIDTIQQIAELVTSKT